MMLRLLDLLKQVKLNKKINVYALIGNKHQLFKTILEDHELLTKLFNYNTVCRAGSAKYLNVFITYISNSMGYKVYEMVR